MKRGVALLVLLAASAFADVYMMAPRGSNGRCDEQTNDRENANRVFDTQNNAAGGFCVGHRMQYYQGSNLMMEWTSQHSCGNNGKAYCNYVVQVACEDTFGEDTSIPYLVRDGRPAQLNNADCDLPLDTNPNDVADNYCQDNAANDNQCTNRINFNANQPPTDNAGGEATATNPEVGRYESFYWYNECNTRTRNENLLILDQNLNGNQAVNTRQNNAGTRNGLECPEERDYYPYFHPTPYRDVAVLTNQQELCASGYYAGESQNVKGRFSCDSGDVNNPAAANNEAACNAEGGTWKETPGYNMPAPLCAPAPWNRDNHLGGGTDGYMNHINITLPRMFDEGGAQVERKRCQMRLRYNISTAEYDAWNPTGLPVDQSFQIQVGDNPDNLQDLENDPTIDDIGDPNKPTPQGNPTNPTLTEVQLAIDTSQYGRTFEDRSYLFALDIRPDSIPDTETIWNMNVRGKRGNIAQVRNCVEYDFTPNRLKLDKGDYVHYQWAMCNYNNNGNAGNGRNRLDRANICEIQNWNDNFPVPIDEQSMFDDYETAAYACLLNQAFCLPEADTNGDQDVRNCAKLNGVLGPRFYDDFEEFGGQADEPTENTGYFNLGVLRQNKTGRFMFMSTRNHDFTNRSQKGMLQIQGSLSPAEIALIALGAVAGFIIILIGVVYGVGRMYPDSFFGGILARFQTY